MSQRTRSIWSKKFALSLETLETRDVPNANFHNLSTGGPFRQDWANTAQIAADDNWAGVESIIGYRGDELTAATGTDPQTIVADGTTTPVDVNANRNDPNTFSSGGVAEFDGIPNPTIALNGSATADAPFLLFHLDTTGMQSIRVSYLLRDLDGSVDNAVQPVALQYRVGTSGNFINVPAAFVADATSGPNLATLETPVSVTLPSAVNNQAQVQLRIITTNAVGNDEWVGVDDIRITANPLIGLPGAAITYTANDPATVLDATATLTDDNLNFNTGVLTVNFAANGTADDRLAIRNQGTASGQIGMSGSNVTFNPGSGAVTIGTFAGGTGTTPLAITLTDSATRAAVQALLRNITFANVSANPSAGARTVQFVLTDGDGGVSDAVTKTVNVVAGNTAPTITSPSTASVNEDNPFSFSGGNAVSITDPDAGDTQTITIATTNGTSSVGVGSGATITNNGSASVTVVGTLTQVNAALAVLTFNPTLNFNGSASVQITANDAVNPAVNRTTTITVNAVNDAPVFNLPNQPNTVVTVNEDSGLSLLSGFATGIGPGGGTDEASQSIAFSTSNTNNALFSAQPVLGVDGTLTFTPAANANGTATVTVTLFDSGSGTAPSVNTFSRTFAVTVNAVNDAPVGASATLTTAEDTPLTFTAANFGFTDPSDSPANAFAGVVVDTLPSAAAGVLQVNNTPVTAGAFVTAAQISGGLFTFVPAPNANGSPLGSFTFRVRDDGGGADTATTANTVTLNVTPVNDAPVITSNGGGATAAVSVPENTTAVTTVTATDVDGPAVTYSIVPVASGGGEDAAQFTITAAGVLTFVNAPDFEAATDVGSNNVYLVTVRASDGIANTDQAISVTVTDVAAGTVALSAATYSVGEGGGTVTIDLVRTGGTDAVSVNFATSDDSAAAPGDYTAATGTRTFGVGVNSQSFTVTVIDDSLVEGNETFTVTLTGSAVGSPSSAVVTITDNDVNQSPVNTAPATATTNEDASLAVPGLSVSDPDGTPGNLTTVVSIPVDRGTLTASGTGVSGSGSNQVTIVGSAGAINTALSTLSYAPLADGNQTTFGGTVPLTISTTDALNGNDTDVVNVTVTPVNDAPAFNALTNVTVNEDSGPFIQANFVTGTAPGPVTASDEAGQLVTLSATNTNNALFSAQPQIVNGELRFTPAANAFGTATVTVTATDNGPTGAPNANTFSRQFTVTVNAVNDAPTITAVANQTINEDGTTGPLAFTIADVDTPIGNLTVAAASGNVTLVPVANFALSGAGASRTVTVVPATNLSGSAVITLTVGDGSLSTPTQFTLTVNAVNDAPVGASATRTTPEDTPLVFATADFALNDPNDGAPFGTANAFAGVLVTTVPGTSAGALRVNGTAITAGTFVTASDIAAGLFTFAPARNANGPGLGSFAFRVRDDGGTANNGVDTATDANTLTLNVTPQNDAPVAGNDTPTVNEDAAATLVDVLANDTDADNDARTITAITQGSAGGTVTLTAGQVRYAPAPDFNGTDTFTYTVSDGNGGTATATVTVTVNPVNDAPSFAPINLNVTVAQDSGAFLQGGFFLFAPGGGPDEAGQTATYTVTTDNPGLFSAAPTVGGDGTLFFTPAAGASGTATVTISVRDSGGTANGGVDTGPAQAVVVVVDAPAVKPPSPQLPAQAIATAQFIAVGTDAGTPAAVRVLNPQTRAVVREFAPFGGFLGGVTVALGDVTGDGTDDLIVGTATGNAHVKVYDIASGAELRSFLAFPGFGGGVDVAAGDVDGDGRADVAVGAGPGAAGGHVKVFGGADGRELVSFFAFPGFAGGVKVAAGDVTGDGRADVAVLAAGPGANGHVKVLDGRTGAEVTSFLGYAGYRGDIELVVADADGDGRGDVITAATNPTEGTHVKAFTARAEVVRSFFAPASGSAGFQRSDANPAPVPGSAARIAAADVDGDGVLDYLLGSQPGAGMSRLILVSGATGAALDDRLAFDSLFGLGVFVDV